MEQITKDLRPIPKYLRSV